MSTYTATLRREDGMWLADVDSIGAHTYAESLDDIPDRMREAVEAATGEAPEALSFDITALAAEEPAHLTNGALVAFWRDFGNPWATVGGWLANLSDMSAESEAWQHDGPTIAEAERVLEEMAGEAQ